MFFRSHQPKTPPKRGITELAVMDVTPGGLVLLETAPDAGEDELREKTGVLLVRA